MPIFFLNEDFHFILKRKKLYKEWISFILKDKNFKVGHISYIFCSKKKILEINKQYLNHDYYTDIITFPYSSHNTVSADIFICIPIVQENAQDFKVKFIEELNRVIIHGILHLLGYNDINPSDKLKMRELEDHSLNLLKSFTNNE